MEESITDVFPVVGLLSQLLDCFSLTNKILKSETYHHQSCSAMSSKSSTGQGSWATVGEQQLRSITSQHAPQSLDIEPQRLDHVDTVPSPGLDLGVKVSTCKC